MFLKSVLVCTLAVAMTGCGGGGSDSGNETVITGPSTPLALVEGEFVSIQDTGLHFNSFSKIGNECTEARNKPDTYFESDNFRVYSNTSNIDDLQLIATIAEEAIEYVAGEFSLLPQDIFDYRVMYSNELLPYVNRYLDSALVLRGRGDIGSIYSEKVGIENLADDFFEISTEHKIIRERAYFKYWRSLDNFEKTLLLEEGVLDIGNLIDPAAVTAYTVPDKTQICVTSNGRSIATVSTEGVRINSTEFIPDYLKSNNYQGFRRIMQHEMVHMASIIVTGHFESGAATDMWFAEGVAEYLSNGATSSRPTAINPIAVAKSPNQDLYEMGLSEGSLYAVFNSAVSYLFSDDGNKLGAGTDGILDFWLAVRHADFLNEDVRIGITLGPNQQYLKGGFINAFDNFFERIDGTPFTYENYESEYIDIHNSL